MQYSKLKEVLSGLEKQIKIKFANKDLLANAFVHRSYLNENEDEVKVDNERLEFLGDAVLEMVTTEYLYEKFPETGEGQLTTFRSALVKGKHLAEVARCINLGQYLLLSNGEEKSGGRSKAYILANAVEALIGAIYLDRGFMTAHKFVGQFILANLGDILKKGLHVDKKSKFQETAQETRGITPVYKVLSEEGPDHDKRFEVGAFLGEEIVGKGKGSSKQNAEQDAATVALKNLNWD
ncbi:MAG: ribonuclease III [Patescibacteria group bacterium]